MNEKTHTYYMKEGDRLPSLEITVLDEDGNPMDLDSYTKALLIVAPCVGGRRLVDEADMSFVGRTDGAQTGDNVGKVSYVWQPGDTGKSGEYLLEIVLDTFKEDVGDAGKRTVPRSNYDKLIITPRL